MGRIENNITIIIDSVMAELMHGRPTLRIFKFLRLLKSAFHLKTSTMASIKEDLACTVWNIVPR